MNISSLISRLKRDCGLSFISLPFEDFDDRIIEVIEDTTLKVFSQYFPQKITRDINLSDWYQVSSDYGHSIYEVPFIEKREVIGIDDVRLNTRTTNEGYFDPQCDFTIGTYTDMMLSQVSANLASLAMPPFTFQFEEPTKLLHLYNLGSVGYLVTMDILLKHANNLATIPFTVEESFYELALLDFQVFLYESLKHFDEIETANGTIKLRVDDWSNAKSDRKELLRDWDTKFHMDRKPIYYI